MDGQMDGWKADGRAVGGELVGGSMGVPASVVDRSTTAWVRRVWAQPAGGLEGPRLLWLPPAGGCGTTV